MKDKQKLGAMQILLLTCVFFPLVIFSQIQRSDEMSASVVNGGAPSSPSLVDISVRLSANGDMSCERDSAASDADLYKDVVIHVANLASQTTSDSIKVTFTLPQEAKALDQSLSPVYENENSLYWSLSLPAESDTTIVVSLSCQPDAEADRVFTAEVSAAGDRNPDNDCDSLKISFLDPIPGRSNIQEIRATGANSGKSSTFLNADGESSIALTPPNVVPPENDIIPIHFTVPGGAVEMKLYDVAGRFITNLIDAYYEAGEHTFFWNGMTEDGRLVGSGVYLITMHTKTESTWKKMIIVR